VALRYLPAEPRAALPEAAAAGVRRALAEQPGDVLVFLPGGREIRATAERLADAGVQIHPLYGDLPREAQDRAIRPDRLGRRRVVLATAIAETSLTIEGVTTVVDAGWARVPRFDPVSGLTRLETLRVTRAGAEQRAGRAGRLGPGVCYRLWSEGTQRGLQPHRLPEIAEADLAPLALDLAQWGVADPSRLAWLDPPPAAAYAQALDLLRDLGAVDAAGRITGQGRRMAGLPLHPRLAHMLLLGLGDGLGALACDLAALIEERDPLAALGAERSADLEQRLEAVHAYRAAGAAGARRLGADAATLARVERSAAQIRRLLGVPARADGQGHDQAGLLLAAAYPDRIAQGRPGSPERYLLASGRGARIAAHDPLAGRPYLVAAHLDAGQAEGRIHLAASLQEAELRRSQAGRITRSEGVEWDERAAAVVARREERLGALVLASRPLAAPDPEAARGAMLEGVRRLGLQALPWTDSLREWQARVLSLRHWRGADGWPDVADAALLASLADWLGPFLHGVWRREHLVRVDLGGALRGLLPPALRGALEDGAPAQVRVPSGSRLRLRYTPGEAPVLAVRLQEMFGLADTPRVCWGQVPVVLHLLSPAHRPIQVTRDLRGFWERTYAEVRKELKGRYPKHHWPEDPWSAPPTARPRR
jgi:ATP-dependent helicase HrpB